MPETRPAQRAPVQVVGTFDASGRPLFWGFATCHPVVMCSRESGEVLTICGWTPVELRLIWLHAHKN